MRSRSMPVMAELVCFCTITFVVTGLEIPTGGLRQPVAAWTAAIESNTGWINRLRMRALVLAMDLDSACTFDEWIMIHPSAVRLYNRCADVSFARERDNQNIVEDTEFAKMRSERNRKEHSMIF